MDIEIARTALIAILQEIQELSGYEVPELRDDTTPLDLEEFDSKICPVAIGMLAERLSITIPTDKNIFLSKDGRRKLTVGEIVTELCRYATEGVKTA